MDLVSGPWQWELCTEEGAAVGVVAGVAGLLLGLLLPQLFKLLRPRLLPFSASRASSSSAPPPVTGAATLAQLSDWLGQAARQAGRHTAQGTILADCAARVGSLAGQPAALSPVGRAAPLVQPRPPANTTQTKETEFLTPVGRVMHAGHTPGAPRPTHPLSPAIQVLPPRT